MPRRSGRRNCPDAADAEIRSMDDGIFWMNRSATSLHIALAAMFTVSASRAALKKKEMKEWAKTVRRIGLQLTVTSETCAHMPITKEK
jgi:hypothetical protein